MTSPDNTPPEPEWWAEARRLRALGLDYKTIAYKLERSYDGVRYVLRDEFRERRKRHSRESRRRRRAEARASPTPTPHISPLTSNAS